MIKVNSALILFRNSSHIITTKVNTRFPIELFNIWFIPADEVLSVRKSFLLLFTPMQYSDNLWHANNDWFLGSNSQLRSRCPKGRVTQNIMFTGDWGGASTSGNQAFPIAWKCLVLCLCIYEGIACDFCRSEVYGHYCSLDKSLFTNLFSSCKGRNEY